jgi:hypothetical protein
MTISEYFVMQSTDLVMSNSWSPNERIPSPIFLAVTSYLTCPDMINMGMESSHPPTTPVMALVPPGPVVTQTAAIRLSILA